MTSRWWQDDAGLLAALAETRRHGPVPERLIRDAKAVFTWRLIDAEIAQLAYDSLADHKPPPVLMRTQEAQLRMLTFRSADVTIELGVADGVLTGQVVTAGVGTVEVVQGGVTTLRTVMDELGCFSVAPPPVGPFALRVTVASGRTVATPEMSL